MTKAKEIIPHLSPYRPLKWKKNHSTWYYGDFRLTATGCTTRGICWIVDRVQGYSGITLRYKRMATIGTIIEAKAFVEATHTLGVES